MTHPDVLSGGFLLLVSIAYGGVALHIPRGGGEPGPGAMPIGLAVLLGALALSISARSLTSVAKATMGGSDSGPGRTAAPHSVRSRPAAAALATIAYVALFQPLGFVAATLAYAGALAWVFGGDRRFVLAVPVGVTMVLYAFFRLALGVRLPTGPF